MAIDLWLDENGLQQIDGIDEHGAPYPKGWFQYLEHVIHLMEAGKSLEVAQMIASAKKSGGK